LDAGKGWSVRVSSGCTNLGDFVIKRAAEVFSTDCRRVRRTGVDEQDTDRRPELARISTVSFNPLRPELAALALAKSTISTPLVVPGGLGGVDFRNRNSATT